MTVCTQESLLGDCALNRGLVTEEQLAHALEIQEKSGSLLGDILIGEGYLRPIDLFEILSQKLSLPASTTQVNALADKVDSSLSGKFNTEILMANLFFPICIENGKVLVLINKPGNKKVDKLISGSFPGYEAGYILATERDIRSFIEMFFSEEILQDSVMGLFYRSPAESAKMVLTKYQLLIFAVITVLLILSLYIFPRPTIIGFIIFFNLLFLASIAFKFVLSLAGAYQHKEPAMKEKEPVFIDENDLPVYSILIPVFHEPETIEQLIHALKSIDYPKDKLDVLFLFEKEDKETLASAKKANPPGHWQFIVVPPHQPQTKPKACNFGLAMARGEFITIYDAEDIPEPDQLKKAVHAFNTHPEEYVCFQAALNYYNSNANVLTRLFTLEYSYWFDLLLHGLDALKLPIPLGGTSNHFRTEILRELGGWDPFNVTEDADLGIRAYGRGYKVGVLHSTTYEEATSRIPIWIKQRSRWLKGYLQTFLVHNRKPLKFLRSVGFKGWFTLQVFIGGTVFTNLVAPFFWFLFLYWLFTRGAAFDQYLYGPVLYISLFNLLFGNFLGIYLATLAVFRRQYYNLTYYALLTPFYNILLFIAAWKAFKQLITNPFYWEKTGHGFTLSKEVANEK